MTSRWKNALPVLLLLMTSVSAAACSSSGATADGGKGGSQGATGAAGAGMDAATAVNPELHWKVGAVVESPYTVEAIRMTTATTDNIEIVGAGTTLNEGITIAVGTPGTIGGTYTCPYDGGSVVELTYHLMAPSSSTCSITLAFTTGADGKEHVTGSFEATLTFGDGGTTTLTEGFIDIPDVRQGG
jgi:hypothetical protein